MDFRRFLGLLKMAVALGVLAEAEVDRFASELDAALDRHQAAAAVARVRALVEQRIAERMERLAQARRQRTAGYN